MNDKQIIEELQDTIDKLKEEILEKEEKLEELMLKIKEQNIEY